MDIGGFPTPNPASVLVSFAPYTALPTNITATNFLWLGACNPYAPDYDFLAQYLSVSFYVRNTTNATNYWTMRFADSFSNLYGEFTTQLSTNDVIATKRVLINKPISRTATYLVFQGVKVNTPGNLDVLSAVLQGRVIGP
jgi:hypothetical protein